MILITGGRAQGKRNFAKNTLGIGSFTDGTVCDLVEVFSAECVTNCHELIRRLTEEGIDPVSFTERLCRENPSAAVITDEVGCGIVPIEKKERLWRENAGRCGCILAENSETVVRMVCGIPQVIKGELR